jgi:hypothetical protein
MNATELRQYVMLRRDLKTGMNDAIIELNAY